VSIARALSKLGACSRSEAQRLVDAGRVRLNGVVVHDRTIRVDPDRSRIEVDGSLITKAAPAYIALNKPRGLVTTRDDPQGRPTVYDALRGANLPFVGPVGRLDRASEGLLLLSNDTQWAAGITAPSSHVDKTYHVQVRGLGLATAVDRVGSGVTEQDTGEFLSVKSISQLRVGSRNTAWFEVVLDEGKNRQLRRIFAQLHLEVVRLVRVAIGNLVLGDLAKGAWRHLTPPEVRALARRGSD
jgi:23S rRNA pseudouridine2605 synthase